MRQVSVSLKLQHSMSPWSTISTIISQSYNTMSKYFNELQKSTHIHTHTHTCPCTWLMIINCGAEETMKWKKTKISNKYISPYAKQQILPLFFFFFFLFNCDSFIVSPKKRKKKIFVFEVAGKNQKKIEWEMVEY